MARKPAQPRTKTIRSPKKAGGGKSAASKGKKVKEIGGPEGPEPTRYGDWERKGIASDF